MTGIHHGHNQAPGNEAAKLNQFYINFILSKYLLWRIPIGGYVGIGPSCSVKQTERIIKLLDWECMGVRVRTHSELVSSSGDVDGVLFLWSRLHVDRTGLSVSSQFLQSQSDSQVFRQVIHCCITGRLNVAGDKLHTADTHTRSNVCL